MVKGGDDGGEYPGDMVLQEEMPPGVGEEGEPARGVDAPGLCFGQARAGVRGPGHDRNRGADRRSRRAGVPLDGPVVGAYRGQDHLEDFAVAQQGRVGAAKCAYLGDDARVVALVDVLLTVTAGGTAP